VIEVPDLAENIPGQAVPYSRAVTVDKAHWVAAPSSLRGTDNVLVRTRNARRPRYGPKRRARR
jgi:hypothetical protein